jgi:ABC-type antimicrobial peptide transport system permease subunit
VLSGAGPLVAGGVVAGLGLTLVAGRLMRALLFGVQPFDPLSIATALLALVAVSGAALVVPMRRAATVNAIDAMRGE